ncbi:MAG: zeta toxin family protein [Pseudomonadota bacterium]
MPNIYIIAGSNGSGKTTLANTLLPEFLKCSEFVNADLIAAGLSPFNPDSMAMQAGRLMLARINQLAIEQTDFAFETTLSTRSYAPYIKKWIKNGYSVHIIFLWVRDVKISIKRVKKRVQMGGHNIPEEIIRRRYKRGIENFNNIYKDIVSSWEIYDNSSDDEGVIIADNKNNLIIHEAELWTKIQLQSQQITN